MHIMAMVSVWSLQKQRKTRSFQLSSAGRRQGPQKEERNCWRTREAEEMNGEGRPAFLSQGSLSTKALPWHYTVLSGLSSRVAELCLIPPTYPDRTAQGCLLPCAQEQRIEAWKG